MTHSKGQKQAISTKQEMMQLLYKDIRIVVTVIFHVLRGVVRGKRMETAIL